MCVIRYAASIVTIVNIDLCGQVLSIVPDYNKMREDILDKARLSLRPNEDPK